MLTREQIYEQVVLICKDYDFDGEPVKITSLDEGLYSDLKLDSLAVVEIIMLCEHQFGVFFESEEIQQVKTVNDLITAIYNKLDYAEY